MRTFYILALGALWVGAVSAAVQDEKLIDHSIAELQEQLNAGRTTSVELVRKFQARIDALDRKGPQLRSIIAVNPDALTTARLLDRERREKGTRGPMHGIP